MATRYIGEARVTVRFDDYRTGRLQYSGRIRAEGKSWPFSGISIPEHGISGSADSPGAYDKAAAAAVGFGSYYTSDNRGDDLPGWAPKPAVADAIADATSMALDDRGRYAVRRSRQGKERFA